jgi:hypothetical protein
MVDWFITTCMETKDDLYYGVCTREVMEKRFPNSKRTYTKLKDMEVCGADINISNVRMATEHLELWEQLIGNRKNPLRQASLIGLDTFFQVFTRSIGLEDLAQKVSRRLGIKGRVIVWPYAEACMDVDKPHQLELMGADLARQHRKAAAPEKKAKKTAKSKPIKKASSKAAANRKTAKAKPAVKKSGGKAQAKRK